MNTIGITKLINLRNEIDEIPSPEELINNYRQIKDHNIEYVESALESDNFIKDIYDRCISDKQYPKRLFAPPSKYIDTHESIKNFFLKKEFIVIVINGKSKEMYFPDETLTINDFNKLHFPKKTDVEMYKTLTKLHQLYPMKNMVITGFNCIERGITFQTNSFNFTDMIIPPIKDIATSVQLIGRANGGKKYVKKHNIWIQKEHHEKIKKRIEYTLQLIKSNPEEICETDFREKTIKEKDMVRWEVPISIDLSKEKFDYITCKKGVQFRRERARQLFSEEKIDIGGYEAGLWTMYSIEKKKNDKSPWELNIIPLLNAVNNKRPYSILHKKDKEKNKKIYSVYFDKINYKVILMKYNGNIPIE